LEQVLTDKFQQERRRAERLSSFFCAFFLKLACIERSNLAEMNEYQNNNNSINRFSGHATRGATPEQ
jgi:hypothetical protein